VLTQSEKVKDANESKGLRDEYCQNIYDTHNIRN
jgi:hypothetical protein